MTPEWQPIETAPKGGLVLVIGHQGDIPEVWNAKNLHLDPGNRATRYLLEDAARVTHWMPLPPPPRRSKS
jgi:hypothetical protein